MLAVSIQQNREYTTQTTADMTVSVSLAITKGAQLQ